MDMEAQVAEALLAELERQAQSGKDLAVTGSAGAAKVHCTIDLEALALAVVGAVAGGP